MRLLRFLSFLLLLAALPAMAQSDATTQNSGIYLIFSSTSFSMPGSAEYNGITLGGYDEVNLKKRLSFLNVGGDARFSVVQVNQSGTSDGIDSYLIGPEISFKTHVASLRPYAEVLFGGTYVSAGAGAYTTPAFPSKNYGEVAYIGGLDWKLMSRLVWRIPEVNYGTFGGMSTTTFSTGLVLRLP